MRHGGAENGKLVFTYDQFALGGLRRQSVPLALRQCSALGFLEVILRGYVASSGFHQPSKYRLTYVLEKGPDGKPVDRRTDEWARIKDDLQAAEVLKNSARNPEIPGAKMHLKPGARTHPSPGAKMHLKDDPLSGCEKAPPIYISGEGRPCDLGRPSVTNGPGWWSRARCAARERDDNCHRQKKAPAPPLKHRFPRSARCSALDCRSSCSRRSCA